MKRIPVLPLTDAKMEAYVGGTLKLVFKRKVNKRYFIHTTPGKTTITPQRKAYFRVWFFKKNLSDVPEAIVAMDNFYKTRFPDSYRGPRKLFIKAPAVSARAPRLRRTPRKAVRAYRMGYNAARRAQYAKIKDLKAALKAASRQPRVVVRQPEDLKKGFFNRIADLFGA
jgi:hypothetical protein